MASASPRQASAPRDVHLRYSAALTERNSWRYHRGTKRDCVGIEARVTLGEASHWLVHGVLFAGRDVPSERSAPIVTRLDADQARVEAWTYLDTLRTVGKLALLLTGAPDDFFP